MRQPLPARASLLQVEQWGNGWCLFLWERRGDDVLAYFSESEDKRFLAFCPSHSPTNPLCVCVCTSVCVTACMNTRVYLALMQSDKEVSLGNHSPLFLFRYDKHCVLEW